MGRRAYVRVGMTGIALLSATVAVLGGVYLYRQFEVSKRVHHWIVWSGTRTSPICEDDRISMVLPDGASKLSGVIHYDHGTMRARGATDLPLQSVMLTASGLSLVVEDAYHSEADDTHLAALPPQTRSRVLLARIVAGNGDDGESTLAYRYFHFRPGEPIAMTLPYEIDLAKLPEVIERGARYSYRASLGPLHSEGERDVMDDGDWDDVEMDPSYLEDYLNWGSKVHVAMSMNSGCKRRGKVKAVKRRRKLKAPCRISSALGREWRWQVMVWRWRREGA